MKKSISKTKILPVPILQKKLNQIWQITTTDLILEINLHRISTKKKKIIRYMAKVTMVTIGI